MTGLHSLTKGTREAIRQLVHSVVLRDMETFTPDQFKQWIKATDDRFRKMGLTLTFKIYEREVQFAVKEIRSRRTAYQFSSSTHVHFEDRDVVMDYDQLTGMRM